MREYLVSRDERGQRLDKYLKRRLPGAPSSFIYKMLRKKNITLRGKKADGSEKVEEGDPVVLYLSDETIEKFSDRGSSSGQQKDADEDERAFRRLQPLLGQNPVLYEDEDVLIVIKPAGVLSQKSAPGDLSMNEWLRGYLGQKRKGSDLGRLDTASGFRPSVCNRLDRNTGGILLCAKSLQGSRELSTAIRGRMIRKTYRMVVHGRLTSAGTIEGDLIKDRNSNTVRAVTAGNTAKDSQTSRGIAAVNTGDQEILSGRKQSNTGDQEILSGRKQSNTGDQEILSGRAGAKTGDLSSENHDLVRRHAVTVYRPVLSGYRATLVEADLITGRSHQLRVHMASIGHPILFDPRYGNRDLDRSMTRLLPAVPGNRKADGPHRNRGQLLWCREIQFPDIFDGDGSGFVILQRLSGRAFSSPEPVWWKNLCGTR